MYELYQCINMYQLQSMPLTKQIKNKTENHGVQVFVDYDGRQPTVTGDR